MAEELSTAGESSSDLETITDKLYELENDPVIINSGSETEISRLFFLSGWQVKSLAGYVRENGRIISPAEISNINGFDRETVSMMLPFITLKSSAGDRRGNRWSNQSLLNNISLKPGEKDTSAPGSQWKILTKCRFTAGKFIAGFTAEKDEGEKYFNGRPAMPDFFSTHISYKGPGILKKVIAGDYTALFGLGTALNTGFRTGMSVSEPGYLSVKNEIRPYTSTDENNFFRGFAAILGTENKELSVFISSNRIDATINSDGDTSGNSVKTLYTAGLHNTSSTISKKDAVSEYTWGINIAGYFKSLTAGFLWTENVFSISFSPDKSKPENLFDFSGTRHSLACFYYSLVKGRFIFSGEISSGLNLQPALTQVITFVPSDRISFNFLYKYYSPSYTSFHGKGIISGSKPVNEEAIYGNVKFEAARYLFMSAGSEIKRYPWVRYLTNFPSSSVRSEIRLRYLPPIKINFEALYSYRLSESNLSNATGMPQIKEEKVSSFSFRAKYLQSESFSFITRIDYKTSSIEGKPGMLLSQDAIWQPEMVPLKLWFRHCIFSTSGWNTRIYTYENDLLNSFSTPALNGKGSRSYLMVEWKFSDRFYLRIKYCITSKIINANKEEYADEIRFQSRIKF
ncbi:MAG: hypothetical protein ACUVTX_07915 [Bacteroidales bacterium]